MYMKQIRAKSSIGNYINIFAIYLMTKSEVVKMKKQKIEITQENGTIKVYRNGTYETGYDINYIVKLIREREDVQATGINLANMIAEIMNDCLNCKSASSSLKDLNDKKAYQGTYFESIDFYANM